MPPILVYVLCAGLGVAGTTDPDPGDDAREAPSPGARDGAGGIEPDGESTDEEHDVVVSPFLQGRWRLSVGFGGGSHGGNGYFAVSLGVGFYVFDGLEVGFGVEQWIGPPPYITVLSPQLRYVVHQLAPFSPYAGVFYRRWIFWGADDADNTSDVDTLGGRVGVYWVTSFRATIGAGAAYERIVSPCVDGCDVVYPELSVAFSFGGP